MHPGRSARKSHRNDSSHDLSANSDPSSRQARPFRKNTATSERRKPMPIVSISSGSSMPPASTSAVEYSICGALRNSVNGTSSRRTTHADPSMRLGSVSSRLDLIANA